MCVSRAGRAAPCGGLCGQERETCRSPFAPSTWVQGLKSDLQAWWPSPLPTAPPFRPWGHTLIPSLWGRIFDWSLRLVRFQVQVSFSLQCSTSAFCILKIKTIREKEREREEKDEKKFYFNLIHNIWKRKVNNTCKVFWIIPTKKSAVGHNVASCAWQQSDKRFYCSLLMCWGTEQPSDYLMHFQPLVLYS